MLLLTHDTKSFLNNVDYPPLYYLIHFYNTKVNEIYKMQAMFFCENYIKKFELSIKQLFLKGDIYSFCAKN